MWRSQAWWRAMFLWRARLFITDSDNWEEGASAETAFSVSLSWAFLFEISSFFPHLFGHDGIHLESGPAWLKDTHSHSLPHSQAHCLTASVSHKQDHNWHFTTYSFCKLSSVSEWRDASLCELFWWPDTFFLTSQSLNHAFWIKCPLLLETRQRGDYPILEQNGLKLHHFSTFYKGGQ